MERDVEFWISVCCEFEVEEQLVSLIKILKYLMALPQDKEDGEKLNKPAMHLVCCEGWVSCVGLYNNANIKTDTL